MASGTGERLFWGCIVDFLLAAYDANVTNVCARTCACLKVFLPSQPFVRYLLRAGHPGRREESDAVSAWGLGARLASGVRLLQECRKEVPARHKAGAECRRLSAARRPRRGQRGEWVLERKEV